MKRLGFGLSLLALLASGCWDTDAVDPMERQPKYKAYSANPFFADGRAMRPPPEGTVPRERLTGNAALTMGVDAKGQPVTQIPVKLTKELLERGQKKFNIYCATCHGLTGDGQSLVASQMSVRPPPSLHDRRAQPVGHYFQVISSGYGLMPAYSWQLSVEERWAVIAYVRALQASQNAKIDQAPPQERTRLEQETKP